MSHHNPFPHTHIQLFYGFPYQVENTGTGRVVAGGTQSLDSVDFFTLTGGLGVLSRSLGLAADNLVDAQVVLADGRLGSVSNGAAVVTNEDGKCVGKGR